MDDGQALDVKNVVWCTGYNPGFSWIDLPVFGNDEPLHRRGIVASQPGLYFVGLEFLYAASSEMVHGVGRDANRIAETIADSSASRDSLGDRGQTHVLKGVTVESRPRSPTISH